MPTSFSELLGRPRVQIGVAVTGLALLVLWTSSHLFISPASEACLDLYRAARTPADTQRVDQTIPGDQATRSPESHSCGFTRQAARWP